jgi:hypothetical protein
MDGHEAVFPSAKDFVRTCRASYCLPMTLHLPSTLPSFQVDLSHGVGDPIAELANAFGFGNYQIDDDGQVRIARETGTAREIEFDSCSHSAWMADWDRLWNPDLRPTLPSPERAVVLGREFMTTHRLLPVGVQVSGYDLVVGDPAAAHTVRRSADGTVACLDVFVGFPVSVKIDDQLYPLAGQGGKWSITFGERESIVNCVFGQFQTLPSPPSDPPLPLPPDVLRFDDDVDMSIVFERWTDAQGGQWLLPMFFVRKPGGSSPSWSRYPATATARTILEERKPKAYVLSSTASTMAETRASLGPADRLAGAWTVDIDSYAIRLLQTNAVAAALTSRHWTVQHYVEQTALEEHWNAKRTAFVEQADLAYYCGDASARQWMLQAPADRNLTTDDLTGGLGAGFLKWVIIDACGPLQDPMINADEDTLASVRWAAMFDGVLGLCGFATIIIPNESQGVVLGRALTRRPVIQAWLRAGRECQPFTCDGTNTREGIGVWAGVILADDRAAAARIGDRGHARKYPGGLTSLWTPA